MNLRFQLSFRPFVAFLKAQRRACLPDSGLRTLYDYLIDQFSATPVLDEPQASSIDQVALKKLFQLATVAVLPLDHTKRQLPYAFGTPVPLHMFHYSEAFEQLFTQAPDFLIDLPNQISVQQRQRFAYRLILDKYYDIRINDAVRPSFQFQYKEKGLVKYYRLDINASFMEPRLDGVLPPLEPAWVEFASQGTPLPDGVAPLPVDAFRFFNSKMLQKPKPSSNCGMYLRTSTPTRNPLFTTASRRRCGTCADSPISRSGLWRCPG